MAEDLALAGIAAPPPEAEPDEDDFEVWPEVWESCTWFIKLQRRWIFNAYTGHRVRLDDQVVMSRLKLAGIKKEKRQIIMDDLLAMESAALEILNRE